MVRFIINQIERINEISLKFTFQYGQIYYYNTFYTNITYALIYIPIWLDLLYRFKDDFIIRKPSFTFQYGQIYYQYNVLPKYLVE